MKATEWLGQMSDASIQQLSRDRGMADHAAMAKAMEQQSEMASESFRNSMERDTSSVGRR